jgi:hypothetical protein
MKIGVIAIALGTFFMSASPAFCDLIPNTRQAPLVIVNLDGSADAPSATEALMEGSLDNNTYLRNGATVSASDSVAINSNGSLDRDRPVLLPTNGDADPAPASVTATPEPDSLALFGLGAILVGAMLRRKLRAENAEE